MKKLRIALIIIWIVPAIVALMIGNIKFLTQWALLIPILIIICLGIYDLFTNKEPDDYEYWP